MSTLVNTTLQDLASGASAKMLDAVKGSAKAWCYFNMITTASIYASYNVSSITDNGTGDSTLNFTNSLSSANFVLAGTIASGNPGLSWVSQSVASVRFTTRNTSFTTADYGDIHALVIAP